MKKFLKNLKREKRLINEFRELGAVTFDLAVAPEDMESVNISVLNKFIRKRVLERADGKKLFLNERELLNYRMEKSKWGMIVLMFILGLIILLVR